METVEDLGRKVKAKYPGQYDDLSDAEVGRRVQDKFPGDYDDFVEVSLAKVEDLQPAVLSTPTTFTDIEPEPINAGETQTILRIISIVLWIACAYLVMTACSAGDGGIGYFIIGIGLGFAARQCWKKADVAFETEAAEISRKTDIKRKQIEFKAEGIREKQAESEALRNLELSSMQQDTSALAERTRQKEIGLRDRLLDIGIEKGLTPESVSAVNEHKYRTEIDLEKRWREIVQDLDAADLLDLSDQQLIKKLTGYLTEQLRERHAIEIGNDPPSVKQALLARYAKNIASLEAKIDERQAGLLLPENEKETLRIGEGEADSSRRSKPEAQGDKEQAPPKRPRGRPRKNPVE